MYKKITQLSFVIGLFFFIVSLILFINALLNSSGSKMNIYTAIVFLIFGSAMMFVKNVSTDKPENKKSED